MSTFSEVCLFRLILVSRVLAPGLFAPILLPSSCSCVLFLCCSNMLSLCCNSLLWLMLEVPVQPTLLASRVVLPLLLASKGVPPSLLASHPTVTVTSVTFYDILQYHHYLAKCFSILKHILYYGYNNMQGQGYTHIHRNGVTSSCAYIQLNIPP